MKTLSDLLERASESDFGITFYDLKGRGELYTYSALNERADRFARHFGELKIKKGDVVALCLFTGPFFIEAFFGCLKFGAIPVCSYPPMKLGDLKSWAERTAENWRHVGAKLVVAEDIITGLVSHATTLAKIEARGKKYFDRRAHHCEFAQIDEQDLAFLQFSSGTTGKSKAVALTHQAVIENIKMITGTFDYSGQSCASWLPLYHDMGLVGALLSTIYATRPLALIRPDHFLARPRLWLEVLSQTRASVSVAPNFAFGLCAKRVKDLTGLDLSNWKIALCGAETVHAETLHQFAEKFSVVGFKSRALTPVYGMAEVALAATFSEINRAPTWKRFDAEALACDHKALETARIENSLELVSVGAPLPGVSLSILNEQGGPCALGELGEIVLSSRSMMREYYNDPQRTREALDAGELRTGDLGFIFDGELYLYGRKKEVIINKGRNLDPSHIEIALRDVAGIRSGRIAACAALELESGEEGFYLFAELARDEELEPEELSQIKAAIYSQILKEVGVKPFEVLLLRPGSLPRTSSGKIQRSMVLSAWREDKLHPREVGGPIRFGLLSIAGHLKQLGGRYL